MRERMPSATAVLMLTCFALLCATMLYKGLGFVQPRLHEEDWRGAQWITHPAGTPLAYFRKAIELPGSPDRAWLTLAALDDYDLYVNGSLIGRGEYVGSRPSALYDLSRLLRKGRNEIAVAATSWTKKEPGQILGKLEWEIARAQGILLTDASWRAESRFDNGGQSPYTWRDPEYSDIGWPFALPVARSEEGRRLPVLGLPRILASHVPRGSWIWNQDPYTTFGSFERTFNLDQSRINEAWLGISADGTILILVNGMRIGPFDPSKTRMDVINIAQYLNPGRNDVSIHVSGNRSPMRLAVLGLVAGPGGMMDFSSDKRWVSQPGTKPVATMQNLNTTMPAMTLREGIVQRDLDLVQRFRFMRYFAAVLGATLALGFVVTGWGDDTDARRKDRWTMFVQPFVAVSILLALVHLANADPRFDLDWLYPFWLPVVGTSIICIWLVLRRPGRALPVFAADPT